MKVAVTNLKGTNINTSPIHHTKIEKPVVEPSPKIFPSGHKKVVVYTRLVIITLLPSV